ncbi:MAG: ChbG/HpnK family deacetylase [Candidatus Paceibacterota bacterium]|jgi:predicted glycoside hydrolase/deacetylase ChbG (UPF0249 family)/putative flippase GtrA
MNHSFIVSADDLGLTERVTDSILETFDRGAITSTSILANGEATDYALQEYQKRHDGLTLAVHLNLTEGKALLDPKEIPHLVDAHGMFKNSSTSLLLTYLFSSSSRRTELREQVSRELSAQWQRIRAEVAVDAANGHQHVHMIPFVFDIVSALPGIRYIRITTEPFYYARGNVRTYIGMHALTRYAFLFLGHRNRAYAAARGIRTNDYLLGFLFSGHMTVDNIAAGFSTLQKYRAGTVELVFHPGVAERSEFNRNHANSAWYLSSARTAEKALLMSEQFRVILDKAMHASAGNELLDPWRMVRFLITGILAFLTTLSLLYVLTEWFSLWYLYSATIAYAISIAVSFAFQKFWTFQNSISAAARAQFIRFLFLNIMNIGLNACGVYLLTELGLWYIASEFFVALLIALSSFSIMRRFIFTP